MADTVMGLMGWKKIATYMMRVMLIVLNIECMKTDWVDGLA